MHNPASCFFLQPLLYLLPLVALGCGAPTMPRILGAARLGIPVNAVGFGADRKQCGVPKMANQAIRDLRRVVDATGGYGAIVRGEALPKLFWDAGHAAVAGHLQATLRLDSSNLQGLLLSGHVRSGSAETEDIFRVPEPLLR